MAIIKPFKGIRPPKELVEQVASRPYDVLNSEEAREEAKGNEKSLYHIIKPEIDFPAGTDEHDAKVYDKAAENFRMKFGRHSRKRPRLNLLLTSERWAEIPTANADRLGLIKSRAFSRARTSRVFAFGRARSIRKS